MFTSLALKTSEELIVIAAELPDFLTVKMYSLVASLVIYSLRTAAITFLID
jgi:hypothetical protein